MKKILTLILFSVITVAIGCKKTEVTELELQSEISLWGLWELRQVRGVQIAGAPSVFTAGNGRLIEFSDKGYKEIIAGVVVKSGTYLLTKESSWTDANDRLIYDSEDFKRFVAIQNNKLTIYMAGPIASDGWEMVYERVQNPAK